MEEYLHLQDKSGMVQSFMDKFAKSPSSATPSSAPSETPTAIPSAVPSSAPSAVPTAAPGAPRGAPALRRERRPDSLAVGVLQRRLMNPDPGDRTAALLTCHREQRRNERRRVVNGYVQHRGVLCRRLPHRAHARQRG